MLLFFVCVYGVPLMRAQTVQPTIALFLFFFFSSFSVQRKCTNNNEKEKTTTTNDTQERKRWYAGGLQSQRTIQPVPSEKDLF